MVFTDWSWEEYVQYINEPKHLVNPVRNLYLFEFLPLELITMTPPWLIPLAYMPLMYYAYSNFLLSPVVNFMLFIVGIFYWSFLEYNLHRFMFHSED